MKRLELFVGLTVFACGAIVRGAEVAFTLGSGLRLETQDFIDVRSPLNDFESIDARSGSSGPVVPEPYYTQTGETGTQLYAYSNARYGYGFRNQYGDYGQVSNDSGAVVQLVSTGGARVVTQTSFGWEPDVTAVATQVGGTALADLDLRFEVASAPHTYNLALDSTLNYSTAEYYEALDTGYGIGNISVGVARIDPVVLGSRVANDFQRQTVKVVDLATGDVVANITPQGIVLGEYVAARGTSRTLTLGPGQYALRVEQQVSHVDTLNQYFYQGAGYKDINPALPAKILMMTSLHLSDTADAEVRVSGRSASVQLLNGPAVAGGVGVEFGAAGLEGKLVASFAAKADLATLPAGASAFVARLPGSTEFLTWELNYTNFNADSSSAGEPLGSSVVTLGVGDALETLTLAQLAALTVAHFDGTSWENLPISSFDVAGGTVRFTTESFSPFVLGVAVPEPSSSLILIGSTIFVARHRARRTRIYT